jgi:preprotein translocase SecE subunit
MYKWPQGRVIRTICLILALVVAADLGYTGAYANIVTSMDPSQQEGHLRALVLGIVFVAASLTALIGGLVAAGFHPRAVDFLIEVEQEMVRVEWPQANALVRSTVVIAIAMCVLAAVILGVDALNHWLLFKVIFSMGDKL